MLYNTRIKLNYKNINKNNNNCEEFNSIDLKSVFFFLLSIGIWKLLFQRKYYTKVLIPYYYNTTFAFKH